MGDCAKIEQVNRNRGHGVKRAFSIYCIVIGLSGAVKAAEFPALKIADCMANVLKTIPNVQTVSVGRFSDLDYFYIDYAFQDSTGTQQWNRLPVEMTDAVWRFWLEDLTHFMGEPGKIARENWYRRCGVDTSATLGPVLRQPDSK